MIDLLKRITVDPQVVNSPCPCATDPQAFSLEIRHQLPTCEGEAGEDPLEFSARGSAAGVAPIASVLGLPRIQ